MGTRGGDISELAEEIVVTLAGMHSADKVEDFFNNNRILSTEQTPQTLWQQIKNYAKRILNTIKSFFKTKDVHSDVVTYPVKDCFNF